MRIFSTLLLAAVLPLAVAANDVTITYQGQLQDADGPVTGSPGMEFRLFDAPDGGSPLAEAIFSAIDVSDGIFQVELEFDAGVFSELPRYLEVEVGGNVLTPRQSITPTPVAVRALSADDAAFSAGDGLVLTDRTFSLDSDFTDGLYWRQGGNVGTNPAVDYLGTSDDQVLEIRTHGSRHLRIEPSALLHEGEPVSANLIGGSSVNEASSGVRGAFIGGGGEPEGTFDGAYSLGGPNIVDGHYGVIGGGLNNRVNLTTSDNPAFRRFGVIVGGLNNIATGSFSIIVGGDGNEATSTHSAVVGGTSVANHGQEAFLGGGFDNEIESSGRWGVIAGGSRHKLQGRNATIPGGERNRAHGDFSFAAGRQAQANHDGAFVWSDSDDTWFSSTGPDQFLIQAAGGVGIGTNEPATNVDLTVSGTTLTGTLQIGTISFGSSTVTLCRDPSNRFVIECTSSGQYKSEVSTLEQGESRILKLNPVHFSWKETGTEDMGLIAEEVAEVEPRLVNHDESGTVTGVRYRHLTALLISAVQEQSERIAQLEEENVDLRRLADRNDELEQRLAALESLLLDERVVASER